MISNIPKIKHTDSGNFFLIAGPCIIENDKNPFEIAEKIIEITDKLKIPFIFKASYRKANRSKLDSFTGIGDREGLEILKAVGRTYDVPVITDIHNPGEAYLAAEYVDMLQIPAFLCRQTDLLVAAAKTGKPVNIKKGQFLSAASMKFAIEKVRQSGNNQVMLTERGSMFGYQDLVVDFRNIPWMKAHGVPVIADITHALQQPNQPGGVSGGRPEMIETIGKAAIAVGTDGIFIETHPDPQKALSDGENMLPLDQLESLLEKLVRIRKVL
ncbi:MAG: 3-deoxy-8-phosphooctulonate synthase [Bacteroidales bacterium]|jgi:2-dehydro-3-deoxyphosphooctonate aldolase (KDO 8-P synthase)|nr:3-deoxy-8-phosphooctulonate synthase [Bacteroidales bacterium]